MNIPLGKRGVPLPPGEGMKSRSAQRWYERIWHRLEEPQAMTAVQILTFLAASAAGVTVVFGGFPYFLEEAIGPLALGVASILIVGGLVGAFSCLRGIWWLERIALLLVGLGWFLFIPSLMYVPLRMPLKVFMIILVCIALFDIFKRYRRIDWAYLDPTK